MKAFLVGGTIVPDRRLLATWFCGIADTRLRGDGGSLTAHSARGHSMVRVQPVALSRDNQTLINVNPEANTATVFDVT
jgi:hypothetical protein